MKIRPVYYKLAAITGMILLVIFSCSKLRKKQELKDYLEELQKGRIIKALTLPKLKTYEISTYQPERNPFSRSLSKITKHINSSKQDKTLRSYSLGELKLVGIVTLGEKAWAIIETPEGIVYRVVKGAVIGNNDGRIVNISNDEVKIVEKVSVNNQTLPQVTILKLQKQ